MERKDTERKVLGGGGGGWFAGGSARGCAKRTEVDQRGAGGRLEDGVKREGAELRVHRARRERGSFSVCPPTIQIIETHKQPDF